MKALLQKSTLCLGASILTLAQAEIHAHARAKAHDAVSPFLNVKRDAVLLEARGKDEDYYTGDNYQPSGGDSKGGNYEYEEYGSQDSDNGYGYEYGDDSEDDSTTTIIVNVTEEGGYYDMGKGTTMDETMTISMDSGYQGEQTSVQLSLITTTVYESSPPQTVTVTSMAEPVTQTEMVTITQADVQMQMITVTKSDTMTQMVTITQPDIQMQIITVTAPGTCTTIGLATADAGAISQSYAMATSSYYSMAYDTSTASEIESVATSILTAAATSIPYASVGYSGQVAQGSGVYNEAGSCDCACYCQADSFPSYAAMAASPTATVPTTMQTVAYSAAAESVAYSNTVDSGPTSSYTAIASSYANTTSSVDSYSTTASSNEVFTLNTYISSSTYATSTPAETAVASLYTSSYTSISGTTASASAQPDLASNLSTTTSVTSHAAASTFSLAIDVSTLSLSSQLVLGNLAAAATPGA